MKLTRQVHLDFHTSEHLKEIGSCFNKSEFQESLIKAKVNSINLFAKCHHSWSYYPTKIGRIHPNLNFDLLGEQIKACKEIGIKTFIYYTMGWSSNDAEDYPEWCARNKNGSFIINGPSEKENISKDEKSLPHYHWKFLCVNTGYHELMRNQIQELSKAYEVDGFWFDIYQVHRLCYCENCRCDMLLKNIDINNDSDVESFNALKIKDHCRDLNSVIFKNLPKAKVFYNGTTALENGANFRHKMYENNSIQDLEDLPTTWGGYDKLPMQAKYFLNAGYQITAMSGKFHTAWGEFGGFKHPDALKYEAASMIALGANCNFGDQLHPNGKIDTSTYSNIGSAYDYIQKIEEFGIGGIPISRLGLWRSFDQECDEGISKMLLEQQVDFDIANFSEDFSEYSVVIFPSKTVLSEDQVYKVDKYIENGGAVISLAKSLVNFTRDSKTKSFGLIHIGESNFDCDYTSVSEALESTFVKSPFLNYYPAMKVKPLGEVQILADVYEPYFSRTSEHYCSHQKTPFRDLKSDHPAITKNNNCIFIAHEMDAMYHNYGARVHREIFNKCLKLLYKDQLVSVDLPSTARINLLHQKNENRFVLHLLSSAPVQRGIASVIEDFIPLYNVKVYFKLPQKINHISLIPNNVRLEINNDEKGLYVIIPKLNMHCVCAFYYS
jgi:hypothetical protein